MVYHVECKLVQAGEPPLYNGVRYFVDQAIDYYPFGKVLREYILSGSSNTKYKSTGHERDKETSLDYRLARYYDSEIGRFLAVDPMAGERYWLTPYNFVQCNPINRIDPTGALDWKPDEDGNLIAEKGDNTASLAKFLGVSIENANRVLNRNGGLYRENYVERDAFIKEGQELEIANQYTRAIKNSSPEGLINGKKSNCHGCSFLGSMGKELGGDKNFVEIDKQISKNYISVNPSDSKFGETIIRFGGRDFYYPQYGDNTAQHTIIYYGTSIDGTRYGFTKNGYPYKPKVLPITEIEEYYKYVNYGSFIKGINAGSSGYYNRRK